MSENERLTHFFKHFFLNLKLIRSFFVSKMSDWLTSLISSEQPEQIAYDGTFPLSDLSDSLMIAHLSWAIWSNRSLSLIWFEQNEQMSKWAMSKWANSQPCNIVIIGCQSVKFGYQILSNCLKNFYCIFLHIILLFLLYTIKSNHLTIMLRHKLPLAPEIVHLCNFMF